MNSISADDSSFAMKSTPINGQSQSAEPIGILSRYVDAKSGNEVIDGLARRNSAIVQAHPFVRACERGEVSLASLKIFLAQHGKYSSYFTRYLCAVIANLKDADDVMRLASNLAEELGFGVDRSEPHSAIYSRMLHDLDVDPDVAEILPGTQALINTMFEYCKRDNPAYGLAAICVGAESIVPALYRSVMHGLIARGIATDNLEFFRIHIECDDAHGQIMQNILAQILTRDPLQACAIFEAANRVIDARLEFFSNIERADT